MLWLDLQRELAVLAQIPWSKGRWKGEGRKGFRSPFGLTQIFWPYCLSTTFGHLFSLKLWKLLLPPNATFMRFQAGELMAFHESSGFKGPTVKGRGNCPFLKSKYATVYCYSKMAPMELICVHLWTEVWMLAALLWVLSLQCPLMSDCQWCPSLKVPCRVVQKVELIVFVTLDNTYKWEKHAQAVFL